MLKKIILITTVVMLAASTAAFAGNNPVSLKTSEPADGAASVAVDTVIVLGFSSNVVNMKVAENNAACFKLLDADGTEVEIDVYLPDDQLEPENKRTITLTPVQKLKNGTEYTVVISAELLAKNGNALGEDNTVSFTTAD